jgi:hypothetical protein
MLCTSATVIPNDSFERAHSNGALSQPNRRHHSHANGPGADGGSTSDVRPGRLHEVVAQQPVHRRRQLRNSAAAARFASASAPGTGSAAITDATSVVMNVDTAASATRDTDARTTRSKLHRRGSAEQASSCLERPHELGLGFNEPPLPRLPWCA